MINNYVEFINNYKSQIDKTTPKLIISGIPVVNESTHYCLNNNKYKGAYNKSVLLSNLLEEFCKNKNIYSINNSELEVGIDGVHLTKESHKKLAKKIATFILKTFK